MHPDCLRVIDRIEHVSDEALREIAKEILERLPPDAIARPIVEKLHAPTLAVLREAGMALLKSGDLNSAEVAFRAVLKRPDIPPWPAVGLALVIAARGDLTGAVAAWRDCFDRFPDRAEPHWFVQLARAERNLGRDEDAEATLRLCTARFPGNPAALAARAEDAARAENWTLVLSLWTECLGRHGDCVRPEWLNGQAMALFRLWRVEEALDAWQDLIKCFPDFLNAYTDMAAGAQELGIWATAQQCYSDAIVRFPDRVRPQWLAAQARCFLAQPLDQAAKLVIAELERRFPDSPLACNVSIELSSKALCGLDTRSASIEGALRRFPNDRPLLAQSVKVLLASGRLADADAVVRRLETTADDHLALISRWQLEIDRNGVAAIRASAQRAVTGRSWTLAQAIAIGNFLLSIWAVWAAELALVLFNDLAERFPNRGGVVCARARALIVLRQNHPALELIELIPALYQRQEILELRAWAAAQSGEHERAKQLWRTILSKNYFAAVHRANSGLELLTPERGASDPEDATAFIIVRNEATHLPEFLRHHRKLGVRRFVFIDNLSSDGSDAYLREQPDVILYRSHDSFQLSSSGMRWINTLVERHGAGGWCLYVDADEMFVYPGWELTPLK